MLIRRKNNKKKYFFTAQKSLRSKKSYQRYALEIFTKSISKNRYFLSLSTDLINKISDVTQIYIPKLGCHKYTTILHLYLFNVTRFTYQEIYDQYKNNWGFLNNQLITFAYISFFKLNCFIIHYGASLIIKWSK
jgi:hypothetical protein